MKNCMNIFLLPQGEGRKRRSNDKYGEGIKFFREGISPYEERIRPYEERKNQGASHSLLGHPATNSDSLAKKSGFCFVFRPIFATFAAKFK
ncbi:MAG: hypothetical protein IK000_09670 [Bacteroidaceae bacterium]|nr:hypothetical protein [Bacteroidaceae bacterium]